MLSQLAQLVPMILKLAQSGLTPAAAAELITPKLDALDDEQFGFLATLIAHPQCVPMLVRVEPRLAPVSAWLEQLAGELRAFITRETSEAPLTAGAPASDAARASMEGPSTNDPAPRGGRATAKGSARGAPKR